MGSRVRHCHWFFINEFKRRTRSFCSNSSSSNNNNTFFNCSLVDDPDSYVLVGCNASSRTVVLNRPFSLNALNTPMMKKLQLLYESWEHNPNVGFVVMKGNGKAFSAGGDLIVMRDNIKRGNIEGTKEIFRTVAILDGITMGGGAGVVVPGTFRIVTDKTVFATPEVLIGHHPDGGASFYLSRLPGYLVFSSIEMMACGLATHYSHNTRVWLIEEHLKNLVAHDPYVIETSLQKYMDFVHPDNNSVLNRMENVNKCFSHETIEEIIDALESEAARTHDEWCFSVLKKLKCISPLSLKVTLRSIREGRFQTLDQCLIREYRMTLQGISGQISSDFCEGVRARMIDKDFAPKVLTRILLHNLYTMEPVKLKKCITRHGGSVLLPLSSLEPELYFPAKHIERRFHKQKTKMMQNGSIKETQDTLQGKVDKLMNEYNYYT